MAYRESANVLLVKQLGAQGADQSHIVGIGKLAMFKQSVTLFDELIDGKGIEYACTAHAMRAKQV
jgi:hypothetical protein